MGQNGPDMGTGMGMGGRGSAGPKGILSKIDEFTTDRAAGSVIGTPCEPWGVANRGGVDTESKLSISSGKLVCAGGKASPAQGDPWIGIDSVITRAAGQIGAAKITINDATNTFEFGFSNAKTGALVGNSFRVASDTLKPYDGSTAGPTISIPTDSTEITLAVILRAAGAHFYRKVGSGYWKWLYSTLTNTTASLYVGLSNYNAAPQIDWIRPPFLKWLPTPLLSDNFTATNGSNDGRLSNGLGHPEGVTGGIGSGGSGVAWSGSSGAISGNLLVVTPGLVHHVVTFPNADIDIEVAFIRTSGSVGVVIGLDNLATPLNFIRAKHDGTNIILEVSQAGTPTTKSTVAATYGDNYRLRVRRAGTEVWVYYNSVLIGSGPTTTLSAGENANTRGVLAGVYASATASFSMALVFPEGSNGEFSVLDSMTGETLPTATIYDIGLAGKVGFGVGTYSGTLPDGFTALSGSDDITSANYGNYQYSDGSVMCWVPKFYYKMLDNDTPDIKPASYFASTAIANSAGYALHRAFIDGGIEQNGFFIDKYECSKNAKGTGWIASSIANGNPISTNSAHNPIGDLTATSGANYYYSAITAPKARDGVDGAINASSIFHCTSRFQLAALAMLSLAHAKASTDSAANAWYNSTSNFPKGNNNNALKDTNDGSVVYTSDGYSNCGKTGSGSPFAATTHNGQVSGVCDLNGNMWGVSIGATCVATTVGVEGLSRANPCVVTWAGHGLSTGGYVQIGQTAITQSGWTVLNDKIYSVTYIDANSFSLQGVDTSGLGTAYDPGADPGTITKGTFFVAKQATAMKHFTSGNTLGTDHWGSTGCAAMMEVFVPAFETAYPNNGFAQRFGDGTGQVLSPATSGHGRILTSLGFPASAAGISASGTTTFGTDYFYQYIRDAVCLLSGGYWNNGSSAGVWYVGWYASRSSSGDAVGFRAACYPDE